MAVRVLGVMRERACHMVVGRGPRPYGVVDSIGPIGQIGPIGLIEVRAWGLCGLRTYHMAVGHVARPYGRMDAGRVTRGKNYGLI